MRRVRHKITTRQVSTFLARLMLEHGMSQRELGRQSGVDQKTINNLVRELALPRVETLDMLVAPFGLECWEALLPGDVDPEEMHRLVTAYLRCGDTKRRQAMRAAEDIADGVAAVA